MKKQKYNVDMKGQKMEVEGYVFNKMWGIDKRGPQHYILTHIETGHLVWSAKTQKTLKELVQEPEFFEEKIDTKLLSDAIKRYHEHKGWNV